MKDKRVFKLVMALFCAIMLILALLKPTKSTPAETMNAVNENWVNNPENHKEVKIFVHKTVQDYIKAVGTDANLNVNDRNALTEKANKTTEEENGFYWGYITAVQSITLENGDTIHPYIYCKVKYSKETQKPIAVVNIEAATLDLKQEEKSKAFFGVLFCNLEKENIIYWDLNGDFYKSGTTDISFQVQENQSTNTVFNLKDGKDHLGYTHESDRIVLDF